MQRPWIVVLVGSSLYTVALLITTAIAGLAILACGFLPLRTLLKFAKAWAFVQLFLLRTLCGLTYSVEGLLNIPSGAHVSAWKHSSTWETIAQMVIFPPQAWVLKRELLLLPIAGWATRLLGPIAINRAAGGTAVMQVVEQGKQRLQSGLWVLVFPEGTRVAVGSTRRHGISAALLAKEAGCLVIPVAHNAGAYWGRQALLKRPGNIRVVIGEPISTLGREAREISDEIREWIDRETARLGG